MTTLQFVTAASIAIGAAIMAVSALRTKAIRALAKDAAQARSWRTLTALMAFFIAGYVAAIYLVFQAHGRLLELLTGVVFLGGALFVYLVVHVGHATMVDLDRRAAAEHRKAEELRLAGNKLQRALDKLTQSNAELARSNSELEQFAYIASHDLQEPLRKVKAFGALLSDEFGDKVGEDGRMYIDRMDNAAGRMSALIDDLLAFSRVTRRAEPFSEVPLERIAREVVGDLEARIESSGGRVEVGELPTIEARPTQMRQLLQNLIANGLKFRRKDEPPVIRVSGKLLEGEGDNRCEIRVADNGIGFDPKHGERIFGIFQRLHGRSEYEGNGVGLAICHKIVMAHGGTIEAIGELGKGATFAITLPMAQEDAASGAEDDAPPARGGRDHEGDEATTEAG
jgi:signal transduction histidine kinase